MPRSRSVWMFFCTTGFCSMAVFMAGAMIFLQVAARKVVVSISSAIPPANLPMMLALAGATTNRSAPVLSEMCLTSQENSRSKVSI